MKIQQRLFKILRKQNVTDGRTHGRTHAHTDARTDNVKTAYPPQTKFAGGININMYIYKKLGSQLICVFTVFIFGYIWVQHDYEQSHVIILQTNLYMYAAFVGI